MKTIGKIKNILISQPKPTSIEKSPYRNLVEKYNLQLHFFKLFDVIGIEAKEFRKQRIHFQEFSSVIFNSKNSVDHFFRISKESREEIPEGMKYFCSSEAVALYLQNYIQYRKRKVFFAKQHFGELIEIMLKHKEEKFLFPCSEEAQTDYIKLLDRSKLKYSKVCLYRSVSKDLSGEIDISKYDMIVVFSPQGVKSLTQNFPDFDSEKILVAAFGATTHQALAEQNLKLTIAAPTKSAPSMAMAIEDFLAGKEPDPIISTRPSLVKKTTTPKKTTAAKKNKSVFANKVKYKQMMEEKKAKRKEKTSQPSENNTEQDAKEEMQ